MPVAGSIDSDYRILPMNRMKHPVPLNMAGGKRKQYDEENPLEQVRGFFVFF